MFAPCRRNPRADRVAWHPTFRHASGTASCQSPCCCTALCVSPGAPPYPVSLRQEPFCASRPPWSRCRQKTVRSQKFARGGRKNCPACARFGTNARHGKIATPSRKMTCDDYRRNPMVTQSGVASGGPPTSRTGENAAGRPDCSPIRVVEGHPTFPITPRPPRPTRKHVVLLLRYSSIDGFPPVARRTASPFVVCP